MTLVKAGAMIYCIIAALFGTWLLLDKEIREELDTRCQITATLSLLIAALLWLPITILITIEEIMGRRV